jgi:transaldolase
LYEKTKGGDGYVSIEVSPYLARDTEGTIKQAQELWDRVNRPNLMVKIPATKEGIPAIRASIAAGINVNVTLIFSLARYAEVMDAYLAGSKTAPQKTCRFKTLHRLLHSLSRASIPKIDPKLPEDSPLRGKAAVANAKLAYEQFEVHFYFAAFCHAQGPFPCACPAPVVGVHGHERPRNIPTHFTWMNSSDPTQSTPCRLPRLMPSAITASHNHHHRGLESMRAADFRRPESPRHFDELLSANLEDEGVKSFADAFKTLLDAIEERRKTALASIAPLADSVSKRLSTLEMDSFPKRLWEHDVTLWSGRTTLMVKPK